jgi:hypothetical protein
MEDRIPESSCMVAVFVLLWSASAVAVKVSVGLLGLGKLESDGAVYVSTFEPLAVLMVKVPIFPVSPESVWPEVQGPFTAVGLGTAVVDGGMYENVQGQVVTVVLVEPPTVAVKVCTCPAITTADVGVTVTVTTFALELPHPDITTAAPAAQIPKIAFIAVRQLMDEFSLMNSPRELPTVLLKLSLGSKLATPPFV